MTVMNEKSSRIRFAHHSKSCHSSESWNPVYRSFLRRQESRKATMNCCVYILASKRNGTLYTGVTSDLKRRIYEHKSGASEGFTKQYHVHTLVWYECTEDINSAITREKQIKAWKRKWKLELIEKGNPQWRDLYEEL